MACADYLVHPFRKRYFEERYTKEKMEVNGKWERAFLLGEGCCIAQRENPGLSWFSDVSFDDGRGI